ncbi:hypothetical protein ABL78_5564 [Leptomonas seymouri]|uniref:BRCT domain-containing protein n=1 Tax=Leptomonas seymouri TaxID=5684 RepID=A0A0N1PDD2_LEPSE|nr:hypothetical protein ABL78_5564 [Leptomonas seymouri]|eukprot:KPI85383.1 hypothetical protein ABL78_5564 [Leptomonas seymouri]
MEPSQRRPTDSLSSLDGAETVESLSQDSGSTVSTTPPLREGSSEDVSKQVNGAEEQLRRRAAHNPVSVPELLRAQDWGHQRDAEGKRRSSLASAASVSLWAAEHPHVIVIPIRWRVHPSSAQADAACWAAPWMPYVAPLSSVFCAGVDGTGEVIADTHTATTVTSNSSLLDSATSAQQARLIGSAQLQLGRSALTDSLVSSATIGKGKMHDERQEAVREAVTSVSRVHCAVHLHFTVGRSRATAPAHDDAIPAPTPPWCHSVDVFAVSPTTYLNGVPLQPHYRYHFQTNDSSCCPHGVLALRLGPRCSVDIALRGVPTFEESPWAADCASEDAALHRPPQRQLLTAIRDRATAALTRASTTSLFTADSTAVLATPSNLSEPVALSDVDDDVADDDGGLRESGTADADATRQLLEAACDDAIPKLRKRRAAASTGPRAQTAAVAQPPKTRQPHRKAVPESDGDDGGAVAAVVPTPPGTVIYTTGLRLSNKEESDLKALGALMNPHLRFARHAKLLVVQKPLMRSVKLLTVLPFVEAVVEKRWLDTVLRTHSLDVPVDCFLYYERKLPDRIESQNQFDLQETLMRVPQDRQRLFAGQRFWVHPAAVPQDPPINDFKSVLTASGGVVTRRVRDANVLVMPQQRPALRCWKPLLEEIGGASALTQRRQSGLLLVVPDDVFKCVLQQRPLLHSTVVIPRTQLSGLLGGDGEGNGRGGRSSSSSHGGARRPSQGRRKTPRSSALLISPRRSTRRRTA